MGERAVEPRGPQVFGRYEMYGEIASGGMAAVHFGKLVGHAGFSRPVAIKRLFPHYARDPEFAGMFLDEARLAARVIHPNVVQTLDVVAEKDELLLVMEYVRGAPLSRLLRELHRCHERAPLPVAIALGAGMLHGLHAAHEARDESGAPLGIVHRDVSPQNVLAGVDGVARVLDFGVAKAAGRMHTTRDGQLKGKLAYMAPEQVRGMAVSRRTDVYAASVVLWELLATQRLFAGDNEANVLQRVLEGVKEPPSAHAPEVPPELDAIVMRGLELDPDVRWATAREMALALESVTAPASASEVGAWVERVAHDDLVQRASRVAAVESDAIASGLYRRVERDAPADPADDAPTLERPALASVGTTLDDIEASSHRRVLVGVGAAAVAVGLVAAVTVAFLVKERAPQQAPAAVVATASASASASAPASAPASETAPEIAPEIAPAIDPAATRAPLQRRLPRTDCNPPYTVDADGHRHFKRHCF